MIHSRATLVHAEVTHRFACFVDPITLTGLALAGLAGGGAAAAASGAFSSHGSSGGAPAPAPPPSAAPPAQTPQAKPAAATNQPSFIGAAATPPVQSGQKSLLGQ